MMMIKGEGEEGERKGEIPNDNDKGREKERGRKVGRNLNDNDIGREKVYGRKGKRSLRIMIIKGVRERGKGRGGEMEERVE